MSERSERDLARGSAISGEMYTVAEMVAVESPDTARLEWLMDCGLVEKALLDAAEMLGYTGREAVDVAMQTEARDKLSRKG